MHRLKHFWLFASLGLLTIAGIGCAQEQEPPGQQSSETSATTVTSLTQEQYKSEFRLANDAVALAKKVEACVEDGATFVSAFQQAHRERLKGKGWPEHVMAGYTAYFEAHFEEGMTDPSVTCTASEKEEIEEQSQTFLQTVRDGGDLEAL